MATTNHGALKGVPHLRLVAIAVRPAWTETPSPNLAKVRSRMVEKVNPPNANVSMSLRNVTLDRWRQQAASTSNGLDQSSNERRTDGTRGAQLKPATGTRLWRYPAAAVDLQQRSGRCGGTPENKATIAECQHWAVLRSAAVFGSRERLAGQRRQATWPCANKSIVSMPHVWQAPGNGEVYLW